MTPYGDPQIQSEARFNRALRTCQVRIEVIKARWKCLRGLRSSRRGQAKSSRHVWCSTILQQFVKREPHLCHWWQMMSWTPSRWIIPQVRRSDGPSLTSLLVSFFVRLVYLLEGCVCFVFFQGWASQRVNYAI